MLICLSMDKWALRGHFYSYMDPVRSLYNIGPCCHVIAHFVFWVELPIQRKLCPIFINHGSWKRGHGGVVSSDPTSTSLSRVEGLSMDPQVLGCHMSYVFLFIFTID